MISSGQNLTTAGPVVLEPTLTQNFTQVIEGLEEQNGLIQEALNTAGEIVSAIEQQSAFQQKLLADTRESLRRSKSSTSKLFSSFIFSHAAFYSSCMAWLLLQGAQIATMAGSAMASVPAGFSLGAGFAFGSAGNYILDAAGLIYKMDSRINLGSLPEEGGVSEKYRDGNWYFSRD